MLRTVLWALQVAREYAVINYNYVWPNRFFTASDMFAILQIQHRSTLFLDDRLVMQSVLVNSELIG